MDNKSFFNQDGAQPAGTGEVSPTPASTTEQTKVAEPVTMDTLEARFQELERKIQSSTDKAIGSVNKKVAEAQAKANDAISMIEQSGITLTDAQKNQITRDAVNKAYTTPQSPQGLNPTDQGQGSQPQADAISEFVNKSIYDYMTSKGVELDPAEMQQYSNLRPDKFIAKAEELIDQKAQNRSLSAIPNQAPGGAMPEGAEQLRKEYEEERRLIFEGKHPNIKRGDADMLSAMIANYRKRGMKGAP
jgi:hypothetical protein